MVENAGIGKAGTGAIANCGICGQRGELAPVGANDDRLACGECREVMQNGPKKRQEGPPAPVLHQSVGPVSGEAEMLIGQICEGANDALKKQIVAQLVKDGTLVFDFDNVIRNARWFSVMDLRRIVERIKPEEAK